MPTLIDKTALEDLRQRYSDCWQKMPPDLNVLMILRQIHENIYKHLCKDAGMAFSGLFARQQYAHEKLGFPAFLCAQSNLLRLYLNKATHEPDTIIRAQDSASCLFVILKLLEYVDPDSGYGDFHKKLTEIKAQAFANTERKATTHLEAVLQSWTVSDDKRSISMSVTNSDGETCSILLRNDDAIKFPGRQWTDLAKVLWKYATLKFRDISAVNGRDLHYQSTYDTLVILEPDFLMDVSSIAECFSKEQYHPELFFINRFVQDGSNDAAIQGKAVNSMLDELIINPDNEYEELFRKCLAENPIAMVSAGLGSIKKIYQNIKDNHFPNLKKFATAYQDKEVHLEATYISPTYGLQGRLDVLSKVDDKYSIVELKSGVAPIAGTWKANQMQVLGYNMIINDCYGASACANCSIFYSSDSDLPLRNVARVRKLEQELLACRNRIVGLLNLLQKDPAMLMDWLKKSDRKYDTNYTQAKYALIKNLLNSIPDHTYEWMLEQLKCISSEIWYSKIGTDGNPTQNLHGFNALWKLSEAEKKQSYNLLTGLKVKSYDTKHIIFELQESGDITNFRMSDIVILYQKDRAVDKQELIRAKIIGLDQSTVELSIRGGIKDSKRFAQESLWSVEHDMFESSLYAPIASLFTFLSQSLSKRSLVPIYLGLEEPAHEPCQYSGDYHGDIIAKITTAKNYFIIQGPPGTGKTSGVLSKYISTQYKQSSHKILILSFTNRAIDEICNNLSRNDIPFIRTGTSSAIKDRLLNTLIEAKRFQEIETIIKENRIWVATVQSCNAWFKDMSGLIEFDELIIDEASQIIEASVLGILSMVPKLLLIGDQYQLPPISVQPYRKISFSNPILQSLQYDSYNQSLLERLVAVSKFKGWTQTYYMLFKHFRMHSEIAELIAENYEHRLESQAQIQKAPLSELTSLDKSKSILGYRSVWIETPPSKYVHYDPLQADVVVKMLDILIKELNIESPAQSIGIIAPFRAMIMAISKVIPPDYADITIDTVERFQGSERDIMIICLPLRSLEDLQRISSLTADGCIDRKLNVALSRSKSRLFIIANSDLCKASEHYLKLLNKIKDKGLYINHKEI